MLSGLWGVVRGGEPIPAYRVPASATLPRLGTLGPWWRSRLSRVLEARTAGHLVVDLRSTDYAAMWRPAAAARDRVLAVRILQRRDGTAGHDARVVSYHSKHAKGRLVRALVERAAAGASIREAEDVAAVADGLGWQVVERRTPGGIRGLDLVDLAASSPDR